jgi:hypothetical protein
VSVVLSRGVTVTNTAFRAKGAQVMSVPFTKDHRFLDSTAERVVRLAPIPVLSIPVSSSTLNGGNLVL